MIPKDPAMLLSYMNLQLRDHYESFEDFCKSTGADGTDICSRLKMIDYEYDAGQNQFI